MSRLWILPAALALVVAGTGNAFAATSGKGPGRVDGARGFFAVGCAFSHTNMDDPIVFPGQVDASHQHTFFGNRTTSAVSTPASLLGAATTCRKAGDSSAYWVPTLLVGGQPVQAVSVTAYYVRRTFAQVQAFPAGLKLIAGDAKATSAQSQRVTAWSCGQRRSSTVPTCPTGFRSGLRLIVNFPSCWNGSSLDSADHKSHLAYAANGVCPATHPVAVPGLRLVVHYPPLGSGAVTLSSMGQFSGHADFVNAWNQARLERLVARYLNGIRR